MTHPRSLTQVKSPKSHEYGRLFGLPEKVVPAIADNRYRKRLDLDQCCLAQLPAGFPPGATEEAMSKPTEQASRTALLEAADHFLTRLREWWHRHNELGGVDRDELQRIAGEFGMTARDLEDLAARGSHAADLLYQRMHALGIAKADVERVAHGLMRDLEKTCACCNDKGACERDLAKRPDDPAWKDYCPNAISLDSINSTKGRFA